MKEGDPTSASVATPHTRCLLLVPRGFDAPLDLLDGLRRRRVTVQEVGDAPAVMVALATGSTAGPFAAVVLIEPDSVRDADRLIAAIRRHHRVAIWRYGYDAHPRLVRLYTPPEAATPAPVPGDTEAAPARPPKPPTEPPRASSLAQPIRKPDDVPQAPPPPAPSDTPQAGDDLSADELAMLLGKDRPPDPEGGSS